MPFVLRRFYRDQDGGLVVFWAFVVVSLMMLVGVTFDFGRMATTQSELQSYADNVSLAAAAELDGRADALSRSRSAAETLISDSQTFGEGAKTLSGASAVSLTFYAPDPAGGFVRTGANVTTDPHRARFVEARVRDTTVRAGMAWIGAAMSGDPVNDPVVMASAVAEFALEACDVAPIAVCLPTVEFTARNNVGTALNLDLTVGLSNLSPGTARVVAPVVNALDGLSVCAGLLGRSLEVCLLAAREPKSACTYGNGLNLNANVSVPDITESLNTRFGKFSGIASSLANNSAFSAAPNILAGLTSIGGLCVPQILPLTQPALGLPLDDCQASGGCAVQGNGNWSQGRSAYVAAHYGGSDPHPTAQTRFGFYQGEVTASLQAPKPFLGLPILFQPKLCSPFPSVDPKRRLMVVAGLDCLGASVSGSATVPVREFFEVFLLGPASNGKIAVEISACLGGGCGTGTLGTDVRDVVRLVE